MKVSTDIQSAHPLYPQVSTWDVLLQPVLWQNTLEVGTAKQ